MSLAVTAEAMPEAMEEAKCSLVVLRHQGGEALSNLEKGILYK